MEKVMVVTLRSFGEPLVLLCIGLLICSSVVSARTLNGFDLTGSLIYEGHIVPGGPAKGGIPAIDQPVFNQAEDVNWLEPEQRVIGVKHNGVAKAYPLAILNWHEIVNDRFADDPVVVTYCPLCGSGVVYRARMDNQDLTFGVSGLLYNSDVLLYDRQTDSLWSQLHHHAISGPMKGRALVQLPSEHTQWGKWLKNNPDTLVLSRNTGATRDYNRNPYDGYEESKLLYFSVEFMSQAFHPKARVIGVELNGLAKAYPFSELAKVALSGVLEDRVGENLLKIEYDAESQSARVFQGAEEIPVVNLFWFSWYGFHPNTQIYRVIE
ncbi:conserved hypothetical protein [Amphritea japonica ATCC BAA-1530]|uniref:DUF3179 domain-containing protein n=2 Tax=Amphritea TaxID=515417 RepID=A0A7R6P2M1_9GAMM|nr:conserved hypothetical protein [Amphritea japonica ATCC BAA-1530]